MGIVVDLVETLVPHVVAMGVFHHRAVVLLVVVMDKGRIVMQCPMHTLDTPIVI